MRGVKLAFITCIASLVVTGGVHAETIVNNESSYIVQVEKNSDEIKAKITVQDGKLRQMPDPNALIISYIDQDQEVVVKERVNDWYKVVLDNEEGYVYKTQIDEKGLQSVPYKRTDIGSKAVSTRVIDQEAKLRMNPDPNAAITDYLEKETVVFAVRKINDWYKVTTGDQEGYIYESQIDKTNLDTLPALRTDTGVEGSTIAGDDYIGNEVVAYAKQFLGNPYVYGGNSLTNGVDCSGFTTQVMKKFGVQLSRSSRAQYASNGYFVSEKNILPGDLVFYAADGKNIDHVAIYAGNNQIIHANSKKTGIKMSNLHYGKPLVGIKRVL